jgi:nucleotide-binding universal stress UspA family protein
VPIKRGAIAEEMAAAAILIADQYGAAVEALHVIRVPLDVDLSAAMADAEREGEEALARVRRLGERFDVEVTTTMTRARALGRAIVDRAAVSGADLIVLGSSPRWRRQSRFFSPTVDFVLRHAGSCEVVIVAFPQSVLGDRRARA